ncbi:MAG: hypothetical protein JO069_11855 [Verrucomicrobia bacterium]|nr:hypothetical protein [Verrucomicrobiota bacterium]
MQTFMRVEFADGVRASNTRLVLMVEMPGPVMLKLRAERAAPQARALEVALHAVPERATSARGRPLRLLSNTPARVGTPESLGEPAYTAPDGCRAWIIRYPQHFPGLA